MTEHETDVLREMRPVIRPWLDHGVATLPQGEQLPDHVYERVIAEMRAGARTRDAATGRAAPITTDDGPSSVLARRFPTMFGATRFVLAAVIVALFGGFVLAGVVTQPSDETVPAATDPDLLPGVDLITEEVEPGVYRVLNDGERDLAALRDPANPWGPAYMLEVGLDGGVWRIGPDREFFRLGDPATHLWTDEPVLIGDEDIEIALDGTVWSANEWRPNGVGKDMHLMSYDGTSWTDEGASWADEGGYLGVRELEIGPDGSVWVYGSGGLFLSDATGWTRWPSGFGGRFHISEDGTRWFTGAGTGVWRDRADWHDSDLTWESVQLDLAEDQGTGAPTSTEAAISPDGTVWMHVDGGEVGDSLLARFDGDEWSSWTEADGVPAHIETESWWGLAMAAARDGSVWLVSGRRDDDGAVCGRRPSSSDQRVSRFDGTAWSHHLDGHCIHALDVADDGTAWVRAGTTSDTAEIYAITPGGAGKAD